MEFLGFQSMLLNSVVILAAVVFFSMTTLFVSLYHSKTFTSTRALIQWCFSSINAWRHNLRYYASWYTKHFCYPSKYQSYELQQFDLTETSWALIWFPSCQQKVVPWEYRTLFRRWVMIIMYKRASIVSCNTEHRQRRQQNPLQQACRFQTVLWR